MARLLRFVLACGAQQNHLGTLLCLSVDHCRNRYFRIEHRLQIPAHERRLTRKAVPMFVVGQVLSTDVYAVLALQAICNDRFRGL